MTASRATPARRARRYPEDRGRPGRSVRRDIGRALDLGLITGAADDDPSAIGTYATVGAKLGYSFLWTAPVTFPMMVAVVYLSSKLGQVTLNGRWMLWLGWTTTAVIFAATGGLVYNWLR